MTEELGNEPAEIVSDQNYDQAAHQYVDENNMLGETPTEAPETPTETVEAEAVEEFAEEVTEEVETDEVEDATPVEEEETYQFEVGDQSFDLSLDELTQYAKEGIGLNQEKDTFVKERDDTVREVEEYVKENQGNLDRLAIIDAGFAQMQQTNPDLATELMEAISTVAPQMNNPIVAQLQNQVQELTKVVQTRGAETEDRQIQKEWASELDSVKTAYSETLKSLGLKPNWKSVQDSWVNSGSGTVEQALLATHGAQMLKLKASKGVVEKTVKRAASSKAKPTVGKAKGSPGEKKVDVKAMDWREVENKLANGTLEY